MAVSSAVKCAKAESGCAKDAPQCKKCGKAASISLRYMNADLCQSHFVKMFEDRVKRTVRQFCMLKKGDRVAVGLSGGKDSTVCLHMLHKISKSLPFELFAITIDEGIAGYRNATLDVAKRECKKLGIPLTVVSFHKEFGSTLDKLLKKKGRERSCSFCGVMRRYALNKYARKLGATKIAIGHNSDDVAQTVFMNFMRNEPERLGRFGPLAGAVEDEAFVLRIKPLFTTPERDVAAYAMMKGIEIEFSECPYAALAFRQQVRKMLNSMEEKYPGTKLRIVKAFLSQNRLMLDGAKFRIEKAGKAGERGNVNKCASCGEPSSGKICNLCAILERN